MPNFSDQFTNYDAGTQMANQFPSPGAGMGGGGFTPNYDVTAAPAGGGGGFSNQFGNVLNKFMGNTQTDTPGWMEGLFGHRDSEGNQFKGAAGGLFNLAQNLGTGYMQWRNMKNLEQEADRRHGFMQRAEGRTVADYNAQVRDTNVVRASRKGGSNVREEIA